MVNVSELDLELLYQLCVVLEGRQAQSLWETKEGLEASHRDSRKIRKQRGGGGGSFQPAMLDELGCHRQEGKKERMDKKRKEGGS